MTKFLAIILTTLAFASLGQNCSKDNIIGQWIEVESLTGIKTNVDSLKIIADNSSKLLGTWTFNKDNSYDYIRPDYSNKKKIKRTYTFDENKCEIILPVKKTRFCRLEQPRNNLP